MDPQHTSLTGDGGDTVGIYTYLHSYYCMKKLFPVLLLLCVLPLVAQTTVSTPEELRAFATQSATSDFEGQTIDLTADIDLAGVTWTPIGTAAKPYSKQK